MLLLLIDVDRRGRTGQADPGDHLKGWRQEEQIVNLVVKMVENEFCG